MRDVSTLKPIGSAHCPQYNTEAKFYIDAAHKSGKRHLVVHYEKGGHNGAPEFVAGIPDDWSEENVIDLILRPLEDANAQFPAWEVPARAYNCGTLFPVVGRRKARVIVYRSATLRRPQRNSTSR